MRGEAKVNMSLIDLIDKKIILAIISIIIIAILIYKGLDSSLYTFLGLILGYFFTKK